MSKKSSAAHAFDIAQCVQCGEWVSLQDWASSPCQHHPAEPVATRWGSAAFPCCGATGLHGTKWQRDVPLSKWIDQRNQQVALTCIGTFGPGIPASVKAGMSLPKKRTSAAFEKSRAPPSETITSGCIFGHHVAVQPPGDVALRCASRMASRHGRHF